MTPAMLKSKGGDVVVKGGGAALCHFFMLRQRLRRVLRPRSGETVPSATIGEGGKKIYCH